MCLLPLLLLCVALTALALSASAETVTGVCGDNVTYALDNVTGELTISGAGNMWDFPFADSIPWGKSVGLIRSVSIQSGVKSIGNYAFYNCQKLTSITIPDGVTYIGENAFDLCWNLKQISIPSSVESIGDQAFSNCDALSDINVDENSSYYYVVGGCLFTKDMTVLLKIATDIEGTYAIPNGVISIKECAFEECKLLRALVMPTGLTTISQHAFLGCDGLTSVTIPSSVTAIGTQAFSYCRNLTSIEVELDNPCYCSSDGILFNKDKTELWQMPGTYAGAYTLPQSVIHIADTALWGCDELAEITITNRACTIEDDTVDSSIKR